MLPLEAEATQNQLLSNFSALNIIQFRMQGNAGKGIEWLYS